MNLSGAIGLLPQNERHSARLRIDHFLQLRKDEREHAHDGKIIINQKWRQVHVRDIS
jgi:hypothetical protein